MKVRLLSQGKRGVVHQASMASQRVLETACKMYRLKEDTEKTKGDVTCKRCRISRRPA